MEISFGCSVHSNSKPGTVSESDAERGDGRDLLCRHMGHCPLAESCFIHSRIQCCSQSAHQKGEGAGGRKPCENYARTSQTLQSMVGQPVPECQPCMHLGG